MRMKHNQAHIPAQQFSDSSPKAHEKMAAIAPAPVVRTFMDEKDPDIFLFPEPSFPCLRSLYTPSLAPVPVGHPSVLLPI